MISSCEFNREESPSFRVYGKFLQRQSDAICKMLHLNYLFIFHFIFFVFVVIAVVIIFIHLSLPKRSIWFKNSEQWLWFERFGSKVLRLLPPLHVNRK